MSKNISLFIFSILLIAGLVQCANQGYPDGGPRDETPPRMISSNPPLNATNFKGDEITIQFNELIVLKEALQKVVVSPPLNNPPTMRGLGNKVTVLFDEELQPATTYTIDFADAIQDNNEGNPLMNFTFSFSTGETQDSLQISGHLFEADTHTPVEGALVMAHSNHADSAFTNMVPPRVAKTNDVGHFTIKNLAEGEYRVFALEDLNRNYRFDQPGERIAWHPDLIEPDFEYRERVDSLFKDSVTLDTVLITQELVYLPDSMKLFLFQEDYKDQYLDKRERNERHRFDFFFNRSLEKPLGIEMINVKPQKEEWFIYEHSVKHDSVMIWLTDSTLISRDSLIVEAVYPAADSIGNMVERVDTLKMFHREREQARRGRRNNDEEEKQVVEPLRVKAPSGSLEIGASAWFNFPAPLAKINVEALTVGQLVDTVYKSVDFEVEQDSVRIRNYKIKHEWKPGEEYQLVADSAAFEDILGRVSNEVSSTLKVKKENSYGTLYIDASGFGDNALLQLLNSKEVAVRKGSLPENGKLGFRYVKPGKYFLRILEDVNGNGEWDTGDFSEGLQPERVFYYPEAIDVRANWDQMTTWDVGEFSIYDFVEKNRIEKKNTNTKRR